MRARMVGTSRTRTTARSALLAAAAAAIVLGAPRASAAQDIRVVQRVRSDSVVERILSANAVDVKRMVAEWREREDQLVKSLRAAGGDVMTQRRLTEELAQLTRDGFLMMSAIEARCRDEMMPRPAGYLGVNIQQEVSVTRGEVATGENRITSVEPGSPAQAAGLRVGDRLTMIGGRDARAELPSLADLLVPGRTVVVRVEREGAEREFRVNVARRPDGFGDSCGEFERMMQPMRTAAPGRIFVDGGPGGTQRIVVRSGSGEARTAPVEEQRFFIFGPGVSDQNAPSFFGGAEFRALDDGWRDVLGVKAGVIVNEVAPGSIVALSGLRGGDVVVGVDNSPVTSPVTLVKLLGMTERDEATLSVIRAKEKRTIVLRFRPR